VHSAPKDNDAGDSGKPPPENPFYIGPLFSSVRCFIPHRDGVFSAFAPVSVGRSRRAGVRSTSHEPDGQSRRGFFAGGGKEMEQNMEELEGGNSDAGALGSAVGGGASGLVAGALASTGWQIASGVGGLSPAGITSGLAAMGGTMVAGVVVFAALPAVGTVAGDWGGHKAYRWWRNRGSEGRPMLSQ